MAPGQPPQIGSTTQGHCDCNKSYTTWTITVSYTGHFSGQKEYTYYWTCLNCGKKTVIGSWWFPE